MSKMSELDLYIREQVGDDDKFELVSWAINQHIQGRCSIDDLPHMAKFILLEYEHEQIDMALCEENPMIEVDDEYERS